MHTVVLEGASIWNKVASLLYFLLHYLSHAPALPAHVDNAM